LILLRRRGGSESLVRKQRLARGGSGRPGLRRRGSSERVPAPDRVGSRRRGKIAELRLLVLRRERRQLRVQRLAAAARSPPARGAPRGRYSEKRVPTPGKAIRSGPNPGAAGAFAQAESAARSSPARVLATAAPCCRKDTSASTRLRSCAANRSSIAVPVSTTA